MKKVVALVAMVVMLCSFTACSALTNKGGSSQTQDNSNLSIGENITTMFFDFKVVSAEAVAEFAGIQPEEGNILVDVVITTTNTSGEELEMYDTDYQLQWPGDNDAYSNPYPAQDQNMAPDTHLLPDGEAMTFHYIFSAPADVKEFQIAYLEEYVSEAGSESVGELYLVDFTLK